MVSTPRTPDPYSTAQQQYGFNRQAVFDQSALNNVSQFTPYGNIQYTQQMGPGGVPRWAATTTLSPELQALYERNLANAQRTAGIETDVLGTSAGNIGRGLDLSYGATEAALNKLGRNTLDPEFAQREAELNQRLANQGLTPGSEGWNYAQRAFGLNRANAYNDLYLRGHQQAVSDLMEQYYSPIKTLGALRGLTQVDQPGIGQLAPTAQSAIRPPEYSDLVQQKYAGDLSRYNAMLGGLFGLGGSILSGVGYAAGRKYL